MAPHSIGYFSGFPRLRSASTTADALLQLGVSLLRLRDPSTFEGVVEAVVDVLNQEGG